MRSSDRRMEKGLAGKAGPFSLAQAISTQTGA